MHKKYRMCNFVSAKFEKCEYNIAEQLFLFPFSLNSTNQGGGVEILFDAPKLSLKTSWIKWEKDPEPKHGGYYQEKVMIAHEANDSFPCLDKSKMSKSIKQYVCTKISQNGI